MSEPVAWTTMPDADDWTFISGHEDPNGKLYGKWFPLYTADAIREAVLAEREACAKVCDVIARGGGEQVADTFVGVTADACASAIRARIER